MKKYYIAYGSNLNIRQMKTRCPGARIIGTGEIEGYALLFRGSKTGSYLTIEEKAGGTVPVAVWEVTEENELALDRYEGFPHFYYKTRMPVEVKGIRSGKARNLDAFVYIMHEHRDAGMPAGSYVKTCLEGYHDFGFDPWYLEDAVIRSEEMMR